MQNNGELPKPDEFKELVERNRQTGWPDLESKDKLLAMEFSVAGSLRDAAAKVGITSPTASRRLRSPLVAAYLDDILEEIRKDSILSRPFIELQYLETLEQANGDVPIHIVDREGNNVVAPRTDLQAKIAVLRQMENLAGLGKTGGSPDGGGVHLHVDLRKFGVREEREIRGEVIDASD